MQASCLTPPENAEPSPLPGENARGFALRAARTKASAAEAMLRPESPLSAGQPFQAWAAILAADTVVVLNGEILGKPENPDHALAMLSRLAGTSHSVITGCVIQPVFPHAADAEDGPFPSQPPVSFAVESRVRMWDCPAPLLTAYAHCGEPLDKAGAYAVQGIGAFLVQEIQGSWTNVVGLPLAELIQALLRLRFIAPLEPPLGS